jgi:hypothetical protein
VACLAAAGCRLRRSRFASSAKRAAILTHQQLIVTLKESPTLELTLTMPDITIPIDALSQQIAQRESELMRLRQEFETRRTRLAELTQQREAIQARLRRVESEIDAVTSGAAPVAEPVAATPEVNGSPATRLTLKEALIEVLREMDRPMTAKQLGDELVRRKFPTQSGNIKNLVQTRLTDLVSKGVLRRAKGQPGVILAKVAAPPKAASAPTKAAAAPAKPAAPESPKVTPAKPAAPKAATPKAATRSGQPSLHSLLTKLLQKSRKPIPARELAEQVLAAGYQTKSKDFTNVVWVALGKIENAERIKGQGWRLNKR